MTRNKSNVKLLEEIIGYDWNYWDIYNLRSIANRIEMLDDTDIHTSTLGRERGVIVLRNLSDILKKKYDKTRLKPVSSKTTLNILPKPNRRNGHVY